MRCYIRGNTSLYGWTAVNCGALAVSPVPIGVTWSGCLEFDYMGVSVDASKLQKALKAFVGQTRVNAANEMRIQARVLAMRLMNNTQPSPVIGRSRRSNDSLLKQSEKKISAQIGRVYATAPLASWWMANLALRNGRTKTQNARQAARAFASLMRGKISEKTGRLKKPTRSSVQQAQEILDRISSAPLVRTQIGSFDGGTAHKNARFGPSRNVPKNQYLRQVVTNPNALASYVKKKQAMIGLAKAGWASCAEQLGGAKAVRSKDDGRVDLPKWVRRHLKSSEAGSVADYSDAKDRPFIELKNTIRYIGQLISPMTIRKTIDTQVLRMISRLGFIAAAEAKKAGL